MAEINRWSVAQISLVVFDHLLAVMLAAVTLVWSLAAWVALGLEAGVEIQIGLLAAWLIGWGVTRRVASKRGWLTPKSRAIVAALAAAYLTYLVWDEAPSPSIERNAAAVGQPWEDLKTYQLTLRYTKGVPGAVAFVEPPHRLDFNYKTRKALQGESRVKVEQANLAARREYLLSNRGLIVENWERLGDVRAWWVELGANARVGDLPFKSADQPLMNFKPARVYADHALAVAGLRALDGRGDEALELVGEVYRVAARLESDSCSLFRAMMARFVQRQALQAGDFVLQTAKVGWAARARFMKLLGEPIGGREGARRLVLAEGVFRTSGLVGAFLAGEGHEGGLAMVMKPFARLVANPQASLNLLHETYEQMSSRAMERDASGAEAAARKISPRGVGFSVKNLAGRTLVSGAVPSSEGVVQSYWETEDLRRALRQREE